ncbi:hypothetical protein [Nocardia inohanensis]|uniref:hypothetical protein n=1 Tax=Nocardia inohanensis TaxID=209246 RepID=UPI000A6F91E8|nr:hypothetical protein [Nocardia inohanensis]
MKVNRVTSCLMITAAGACMLLSTAGTAAAEPAVVTDSTHPAAASWNQLIWNGAQGVDTVIHGGINVLFGGAYGGGGNPFGSDQGTWWYQLGKQIDAWSHSYNQHGNHTCYDGDTPYPCG